MGVALVRQWRGHLDVDDVVAERPQHLLGGLDQLIRQRLLTGAVGLAAPVTATFGGPVVDAPIVVAARAPGS